MARALPVGLELTSSHWGAWEIRREAGQPTGLAPWRGDPDPNPIGPAVWEADDLPCESGRQALLGVRLERLTILFLSHR